MKANRKMIDKILGKIKACSEFIMRTIKPRKTFVEIQNSF